MNRTDLIRAMATKTGQTQKDTEASLIAFMDVVMESLAKGDRIGLVGFGSFEVSERAEREGINPQTKEKIMLSASKSPKFKPAKAFKDRLNA